MKMIGGYNDEAKSKPLHDYQCRAVDFIIDRLFVQDEMGAGLFLDPGLGKTRTSLTALDMLFDMEFIKRALILAPLRPLYSVWPQESTEWGFPRRPIILHKQLEFAMGYNREIELMNFGSLKKISEFKNRWDILVVDESTYLKNWSSKRMGFVKKMIKTIPKRLILTGTPAANSLSDLFSQMFIVDDGKSLGRTVTKFRSIYCTPGGWQGKKWLVKGGSQVLLDKAIDGKVLRMQAEDYLDMPDLIQNNIYVDLPKKIQGQYKRFEKELVAQLENEEIYAPNASSAYTKCRQMASGPIYLIDDDGRKEQAPGTTARFKYAVAHKEKFEALKELAESVNGKPILIFYNFRNELQELEKLPGFSKHAIIQGGMKEKEVAEIVDKWNNDKYNFLFCQWKAASHGLNLQKGSCSDIACFSLTDSPETYEQAYRRIYRQGVTTQQVRVHRLLTRNTVEEVQLERLEGKFKTQKEFLDALKQQAQSHLKKTKK